MPRWRWAKKFPGMEQSLLSALRNPTAPALLSDTGSNPSRHQFCLQVLQHAESSAHSKSCWPWTPDIVIARKAYSHLEAWVFTLPCCLSFISFKICLIGWLSWSIIHGVVLVKQWHRRIIFVTCECKNHSLSSSKLPQCLFTNVKY